MANEVNLGRWEEIVGRLKALMNNGDGTTTLIFMVNLRVVKVKVPDETQVSSKLLGRRVGLLRTDDPGRPYIIRVIEMNKGDGDESS
ncbi:MAG: hypothetical protein QXM87_08985 [Candidatus Bathyarchaeia archaeon]